MSSSEFNPWTDATEHAGLVSIGTHSLYLSISGPPRRRDNENKSQIPNELVIVFAGAGDITLSWDPVLRLVQSPSSSSDSPIATPPRILIYDRSGLGQSERGPNRLIATNAANELLSALRSTGLIPFHKSLILLAHSYGAIVAREFLHLVEPSPLSSSSSSPSLDRDTAAAAAAAFSSNKSQPQPRTELAKIKPKAKPLIKALILAEPSSEKQHLYFPHPNPDFISILGTLNFAKITGLRANAKLSTQEWRSRAMALSSPSTNAAAQEETSNYVEVCETLARKRQIERKVLGTRPLVVIRAEGWREYQAVYTAGVEAGNGSLEERERFKRLLEGWGEKDGMLKEGLLGLSDFDDVLRVEVEVEREGLEGEMQTQRMGEEKGCKKKMKKMVLVKKCGHNLQLTRPDVLAGEVYWVLDILRGEGIRGGD